MTVEIDPVEFEDKTGQDLDHAGSGDIWEFLHQMNPSYSNNLMWSIEEEAPPPRHRITSRLIPLPLDGGNRCFPS